MADEYQRRSAQHRDRTMSRITNSDAFKPLILVVASAGAKAVAAANGGLRLADLLQPFATIRESVPIRNKERAYNLQQFGVRFVEVDQLMPAADGAATSFIDQTLTSIVKKTTPGSKELKPSEIAKERLERQQLRSSKDVNKFFDRTAASSATNPRDPPDMTPWWTKLVDELSNECLRGQQWDMFCHPIVLLYVVSSTSEPNQQDPVALATNMLDPRNLPAVMTSGQYNRNVPSMIVVVHDNQKTSIKKPESIAKKISSSTGMPKELVKVLKLNSFAPDTTETSSMPDLWTPTMSQGAVLRAASTRASLGIGRSSGVGSEGGGEGENGEGGKDGEKETRKNNSRVLTNKERLGGCMAPEDMISLQNFMSELIQNIVVRQIESRIFSLTTSVAKSKGGMRNAIKSW